MNTKSIFYSIKELEKHIIKSIMPNCLGESCGKATPTQIRIIGYILDNPNVDIYQKDLEEKLNLSRATISDVLLRMEKKELIKREVSEFDARSKKIILGEKSQKFFKEKINNLNEIENKVIRNISKEELEVFNKVINKMLGNIKGEVGDKYVRDKEDN